MEMGRMVAIEEYILYWMISWSCDTKIVIGFPVNDKRSKYVKGTGQQDNKDGTVG